MIDNNTNCINLYEGNEPHVIIPDNINASVLFDDLFKGHTELESITFPDTIAEIGGFVFDGCMKLRELTLPPHLTSMWQYALTRCGIETISVPGSVVSIIPFTFNQCKNLREVRINEGTTHIYSWAFKDCTSLTDVYLPKSVTTIGDKAFAGCGEIKFHR